MKQFVPWQTFLSFGIWVFKIIPISYRFKLGKLAIKLLTPFAKRFSLISPPPFAIDNYSDYLWSALFTSLTYHGIEFGPKIIFRESQRDISKGAIMVSGHFFLNYFMIRWLFDKGYKQTTIMRDCYEQHQVIGTKDTIEVINPTSECLIKIKSKIKAGEIITICVDHCEQWEGWQKLDIPNRQIYISDIIFKFAERLNIPLVFFGTQINSDREIEIYTTRPVSKSSTEVITEFNEFLKTLLTKPQK